MDQQSTYRAGGSGTKSAPNAVNGIWELHTVKGDHGTYLFRFNATTGDCYSLDLKNITNGWQLVPSVGLGISDAGVTGVTSGVTPNTTGRARADKVTAGSI